MFAACAATGCGPAAEGAEGSSVAALKEPASLKDPASSGTRVCSWNVRRLGHQFDNRAKDMAATKAIIDENCDIVAVQEVMQRSGGVTPGYEELLDGLGKDWKGVLTEEPRPNTTSSNAERYAFYFRKSAASLCRGWKEPRYFADEDDLFLREPAWICLSVKSRDRALLLATYHAVFGTVAQRREEVSLLDDDLDGDGQEEDVLRAIRGSKADADVMLLGDFNLTSTQLPDVLPTYTDITRGGGSTINADDGVTDNLYDHVLLASDEPLLSEVGHAEVLDVRSFAEGDTFYRSISDHLPIRFVLGRQSEPAR